MSSRHTKPPLASHLNSARNPANKKENLDEAAPDKRRKIGVGKITGSVTDPRARQVLSSVNVGPNPSGSVEPTTAAGSDAGSTMGIEFESREDVERLLNEKMKGKNKMDFKGKSEQMTEYIKKLRICIKWYMDLEDNYKAEQEKLQSMLNSEERRHHEIETQMGDTITKRDANIEELVGKNARLLERLQKEEASKLSAIKSYEDERDARVEVEILRNSLSEEVEKLGQEINHLSEQLKMVQETNKRLQEYNASLQQYNSNLQADVVKNGESVSKLQKEKSAVMENLAGMRELTNSLKSQLGSSRSSQQEALNQKEELEREVVCLRSDLQQVRDARETTLSQLQSLNEEVVLYKELNGKSSKDLYSLNTKAVALEDTCSSQREEIRTLEYQLAAANEKLKRSDLTAMEKVAKYKEQSRDVEELQNRLASAELQIVEGDNFRKKLHNTILELKGNIRVFCRVRPVLHDNDGAVVSYPTTFESLGRGIDLMYNSQKYSFTFDKVFSHDASQEDVFVEISQLVQSAFDGYKVCIFAYGQTGSGKTYTMMGNSEPCEQKGLIPRSLEQVFHTSQALKKQGWEYKMQASMLEIYNETIRDLLAPNRVNTSDPIGALSKQYAIKHDPNGNAIVSDLTIVDVCSIKEVSFLLQQAAQSRSVGRTQMNEQSSRSHFVITLRIVGVNESTEQQVQGVLNLIDLAGSERLTKSGSTGDRLKETQAINRSLSALSDVIYAIAKKDEHVPFRNSKLTYLLQPCLGGDSKTLMFANISPEASSSGESICSLRFAARVNSCEIGIPRRQTQTRSSDSRLSYG